MEAALSMSFNLQLTRSSGSQMSSLRRQALPSVATFTVADLARAQLKQLGNTVGDAADRRTLMALSFDLRMVESPVIDAMAFGRNDMIVSTEQAFVRKFQEAVSVLKQIRDREAARAARGY
jgi:hypothetical protein